MCCPNWELHSSTWRGFLDPESSEGLPRRVSGTPPEASPESPGASPKEALGNQRGGQAPPGSLGASGEAPGAHGEASGGVPEALRGGPLLHSGVPELRGLTAFFRLSESSKCARHRDFDRGSIRVCYSIAPRIPPGRAFFVRNRGS